MATDRYIQFWLKMVNSYLSTNSSPKKIQWVVFTDRRGDIDEKLSSTLGESLLVVEIEHKPWPFPTLLRYQNLLSVSEQIHGDIVMHLDADMLFQSDLDLERIKQSLESSPVNLVRHPGYFRPAGIRRLFFYFTHFNYFLRDLKTFAFFGALGTWERNKNSQAFVPRRMRSKYVCGGTWLGKKSEIIKLCEILSQRIIIDLDEEIIASFHDESYLNWYQAQKNFFLLSPEFCYEPTYPQLKSLIPTIIAVDKNHDEEWVR